MGEIPSLRPRGIIRVKQVQGVNETYQSTEITRTDQITPEWLTAVLQQSGALPHGSVVQVKTNANQSVNAQMVQIRPLYSTDAPPNAPSTLLLKLCTGNTFGPSEVNYYTKNYIDLANPPIPRCYHAHYTAEPRHYHILMADLSATHQPARQQTPTLAYALALAEAFATLHAHCWGQARLEAGRHSLPTETTIGRYLSNIQPGLTPLIETMGDTLSPLWPIRYTKYSPITLT